MAYMQDLLPQYFSATDICRILVQFEGLQTDTIGKKVIENMLILASDEEEEVFDVTGGPIICIKQGFSPRKRFFFAG